MFEFVTPHGLFRTQIHTLRERVPGVLDGDAASIHDARVATRRIREVLPMLGDPKRQKHLENLYDRFKKVGRSLGRVRDADVRIALLLTLESRMPHAAPSLVVLRQKREEERLALLRKLIRKLERLEAVRLIDMLDDHHYGIASWGLRAGRTWRRDLRYTMRDRARAAREAIEHATGVYFPDRSHAARIAIKKLRYAMEIANETRSSGHTVAIRELKKAQDLLGELHDRQELIDNLSECVGDKADEVEQVQLLKQVLDAECRDLHGRYLVRRKTLTDICKSEVTRRQRGPARSLIAAGALVLTSGVYSKLR
jgi:CHAD domain-containing protein